MLQFAPNDAGWPRRGPVNQKQMINSWMARRACPFYETRLRERVAQQTGPAMTVDVEWVDTIPLTPSGKRRVTIREIDPASA